MNYETETKQVDLQPYRKLARLLARGLQSVGIDASAHDAADYEAKLLVDAWQAVLVFRERYDHIDGDAERRYAARAMRNRAKNYHRSRTVQKRAHERVPDYDQYLTDGGGWERRYHVGKFLEKMVEELPTRYVDLLGRVALEGGALTGGNRSDYRHIKKARNCARDLLDGSMPVS